MVREYGTDAGFELSCGLALAEFAVAPAAVYTAPAQQIVSPFTSATPTKAARVQGLNSRTPRWYRILEHRVRLRMPGRSGPANGRETTADDNVPVPRRLS